MVMKNLALLAIAASAVVCAEANAVNVPLHHPVVKQVTREHGKVRLVLEEGATVQKKHAHSVKKVEHKNSHQVHHVEHKKAEHKKHSEVKKVEHKKHAEVKKVEHKKHAEVKKVEHKKHAEVKKVEHKKHAEVKKVEHKKHAEVKKVEHKKHAENKHHVVKSTHEKKHAAKKAHEEVDQTNEYHKIERKYAHGKVVIMAKNQPEQSTATDAHHKGAKKQAQVPVKKVAHKQEKHKSVNMKDEDEESSDEVQDVSLENGQSVSLSFGGHDVELTLLENGSLALTADNQTQILPAADEVDLEIDGSFPDDGSSAIGDEEVEEPVTEAPSLVKQVEEEVSTVAKKFTEFATKMTGNGKVISAQMAPFVFVCGVIGALAVVAGIAAVAVGRARDNAAAADPQSVLADAAEDVEAAASVQTTTEDAAADDSESLSDSESDVEHEEGKFANEVVSV